MKHPGATELLAKPPADLSPTEHAHQLVLHDAAMMLARRAFYSADYARALELLRSFQPEPDQKPRHTLLIAGALRALHEHEAATQAFRTAAALSGDPSFRNACTTLATHAATPFDPQSSPWASD